MCSSANAASFGHSRIVSALGQPLHVNVPVTQLSADELRTLAVAPAPLSAWQQAGLIPPVDLAALKLDIIDGYTPETRVISLRSTEPFDRPVVDLLLDVSTSSGRQRYQVSLLAQAPYGAAATQRSSDLRGQASQSAAQRAPAKAIRVRRGDTMFAIARRNAVPGVTIFQMMIALQRANPQAFIHDNVNLVKAGATLRMPDRAALTAISDREARRIFQQHAQAFALYRQRAAASVATVAQEGSAASGVVSAGSQPVPEEPLPGPQDQLRLSGSPAANGANGAGGGANSVGGSGSAVAAAGTPNDRADVKADDSVAASKEAQESEKRVSQLEENVRHLNEALRSQGGAASDLIVEGAKGLSQTLSDAASVVTGKPAASSASGMTPGEAAGAAPASSSGSASGTISGSGPAGPDGGRGASTAAGGNGSNAASTLDKSGATTPTGAPNGNSSATQAKGGNAAPTASTSVAPDGGSAGASSTAADPKSVKAPGSTGDGVDATKPGVQSGSQSAADPAGRSAGANGLAATPGLANGQGTSAGQPGAAAQASASSPSASTPAPASGSSPAGSSSPGSSAGSGPTGPASAGGPGSTNKADASEGGQTAGQGTSESSTKAEQIVSWLQEHMLGVITGVLALIVLIIAWLLRRANTVRDDGRDDSAGLITEAMVKEKLDQINLDLEQQVADDARSRRG